MQTSLDVESDMQERDKHPEYNKFFILLTDVNDFIFSKNKVDRLDGEAFQVNANGRISFERNNFSHISHSALSGMVTICDFLVTFCDYILISIFDSYQCGKDREAGPCGNSIPIE